MTKAKESKMAAIGLIVALVALFFFAGEREMHVLEIRARASADSCGRLGNGASANRR